MSDSRSVPTLDDVALLAGVSTATVSRCINTPERVIERTRAKVKNAIETLGYTPNFGARVMAAKRTSTIGAIIPTMENAIFARGLQAFQEKLREHGYTLLVSSSLYRPEIEREQIRSLVGRGADGILLIGHERDPDIYDYLSAQNIPVLIAWAYSAKRKHPSVGFDNRKSMSQLTDEVLKLGHSQIGVISAHTKGNDRAAQRLRGIKHSVKKHGLDPKEITICETEYDIENGGNAFEHLMNMSIPPTVVMCGNDVLAAGVIKRANELGIRIPEDVSVTGFDDLELASVVVPQLTTVHVPHREMGRTAATVLVDMVEKRNSPNSTELHASLRMRDSLAVPKPIS